MATNGNNLEQNFDALLQAHVKTRESASRTTCEQFDAEAANAYLERALTKNALIAYEAHLADCVSCRRHIIALTRLMPAPIAVSEASAGTPHAPLKERLIEWFAGWHLGALAGLGAVAATVLVIAVIENRPRPTEQMIVASKAKDEPVVMWQATPAPARRRSGFGLGKRGCAKYSRQA